MSRLISELMWWPFQRRWRSHQFYSLFRRFGISAAGALIDGSITRLFFCSDIRVHLCNHCINAWWVCWLLFLCTVKRVFQQLKLRLFCSTGISFEKTRRWWRWFSFLALFYSRVQLLHGGIFFAENLSIATFFQTSVISSCLWHWVDAVWSFNSSVAFGNVVFFHCFLNSRSHHAWRDCARLDLISFLAHLTLWSFPHHFEAMHTGILINWLTVKSLGATILKSFCSHHINTVTSFFPHISMSMCMSRSKFISANRWTKFFRHGHILWRRWFIQTFLSFRNNWWWFCCRMACQLRSSCLVSRILYHLLRPRSVLRK